MSYGTAEAYRALARQAADQKHKAQQRLDQIRERMGAREAGGAPDEPLACPRCAAVFSFGGTCPDCAEPLVSVSDAASAGTAPTRTAWHKASEVLVGALIAALTLASIYGFYWLVAVLNAAARA